MKIAVNVRFLIKNKLEGIGVFTYEVFERIANSHKEHQFYFLFDRNYDSDFVFSDNITPVVVYPPARHPVLWHIWFNYSLNRALKKINPDIFISTDGFIPLTSRFKTLNVIHDLAFEHYPKDIRWLTSFYYRRYFPKFALRSTRIATVSEFSKKDIIDNYNISKDKIDVVFNGSSSIFKPISDQEKKSVKKELTGGYNYFVYVGALHSRKNISRLLKSFDLFLDVCDKKFKLVIIGRKAWKTEDMMHTFEAMNHKSDVIFTGRVSDKMLVKYVGAAYALTYISYFEGFGLPILEAMNCDIPVITSDRTSLPEVAGEAGLIADPFNIKEISHIMKLIAENPKLRNELIAKGRLQRQKYSWDITAELLWQSILKISETKTL